MINFITHTTPGYPDRISWEWGSLVKLLKKILVDGGDWQQASGVSYDQSKEELTLTVASSVEYYALQKINIKGHGNSKVNNTFPIKALLPGKIILKAKDLGSVDSTAVEFRSPPLGWEIVHDEISTKGMACFKNKSVSPTILRIYDAPISGWGANQQRVPRISIGEAIDSKGDFINDMKAPYYQTKPDIDAVGNGTNMPGHLSWLYTNNSSGYVSDIGNIKDRRLGYRFIGDDKTFYFYMDTYQFRTPLYGCGECIDWYSPTGKGQFIVGCNTARGSGQWLGDMCRWLSTRQSSNYCFHMLKTTSQDVIREEVRCEIRTFNVENSHPSYDTTRRVIYSQEGLVTFPLYIDQMDYMTALRGKVRGVEFPFATNSLGELQVVGDKICFRPLIMSNDNYCNVLFSTEDWE